MFIFNQVCSNASQRLFWCSIFTEVKHQHSKLTSVLLLASGATLTLLWRERRSLCVVVNKETWLLSDPPDPPLSVLTPPHTWLVLFTSSQRCLAKHCPLTHCERWGDIWERVWALVSTVEICWLTVMHWEPGWWRHRLPVWETRPTVHACHTFPCVKLTVYGAWLI